MIQHSSKTQHSVHYGSNDRSQVSEISSYTAPPVMHNQTFYNSNKPKPNQGIVVNRNLVVKLDQKGNQVTQHQLESSILRSNQQISGKAQMQGGYSMAQRSKIQTRSVGERISKERFPSVNETTTNSTGHVTVG